MWEKVRPRVIDLEAWPQVPAVQPWKEGICAAIGANPATFWLTAQPGPHLCRPQPELVGSVGG
ncbi:MAG: DUF3097 family protein [Ilumatobacteraceae bacterium]